MTSWQRQKYRNNKKKSVVARGGVGRGGMGKQVKHRDFQGSETTVCDAVIIVDT